MGSFDRPNDALMSEDEDVERAVIEEERKRTK